MFVEKTPLAQRVEKLLGSKCPHKYWCHDYSVSLIGCGDAFAHSRVPLLKTRSLAGETVKFVELLPRDEWKRKAILAVGDKKNRLKWVAAMVLYDVAFDIFFNETKFER